MRKPKEKPAAARTPKQKLALAKQTIRDLDSKSRANKVKGAQRTNNTACCNIIT